MTEPIVLRWSSIHAFMKCQRKYKLTYVEKLSKPAGTENRARILGSHVHAGLQAALIAAFNGEANQKTLTQEAVKAVRKYNQDNTENDKRVYDYESRQWVPDTGYYLMMTDVLNQAIEIIRYQVPRIGLGTQYDVANVGEVVAGRSNGAPAVEWTFEVPFKYDGGNSYIITGTIDAVLQDRETGEFLLVDWKTRGIMPDAKLVDLDGQLKLYAAVINHLAGRSVITRTVQYQIRNSVPKPAQLTEKKKQLSLGQISSTWEVWSESVRGLGLDPEKYREQMMPKLRPETDYTHAIFSPVTPAASKITLSNVLMIGEAIRHAQERGTYPAIPSLTGCRYCEFKSLCRVADFGGDVEFVKQHEYVVADPAEVDVDVEAE